MSAASGIQRLTRPLSGQIGTGRVYRDLRSRVGRRNPDFSAPEGPIFTCLRACGSFQRNTLPFAVLASSRERRMLIAITGSGPGPALVAERLIALPLERLEE